MQSIPSFQLLKEVEELALGHYFPKPNEGHEEELPKGENEWLKKEASLEGGDRDNNPTMEEVNIPVDLDGAMDIFLVINEGQVSVSKSGHRGFNNHACCSKPLKLNEKLLKI